MTSTTQTRVAFILLAMSSLTTSCYTTTIASGKPVSPATVAFDARWHHGIFWGMAELSPPYDLSQVCPHGWAEITTEKSFLNGVLSWFTDGLYESQSVSIRCSAVSEPTAKSPAVAPTSQTADPTGS